MMPLLMALIGGTIRGLECRIQHRLLRYVPRTEKVQSQFRPLLVSSAEYYRLYKFLYLQAGVQARAEDSLAKLYRVTDHPRLRAVLYRMAEVLTNSNEIRAAIELLRPILIGADGETFLTILENIRSAGLRREAFERFDRMLFQKYLIDLAARTKRMKRQYFTAVFLFCSAIFGALLLPMIQQMIDSLNVIFQ